MGLAIEKSLAMTHFTVFFSPTQPKNKRTYKQSETREISSSSLQTASSDVNRARSFLQSVLEELW